MSNWSLVRSFPNSSGKHFNEEAVCKHTTYGKDHEKVWMTTRVKKRMGHNLALKYCSWCFFLPLSLCLSVSAALAPLSNRMGSVQGAAPAFPLCYGHAQSLPSLPHPTGVWSCRCRHIVQLCSGRLQPSITGWDSPVQLSFIYLCQTLCDAWVCWVIMRL